MLNTKLALKGSRRLALAVTAFAAMQIGCGSAPPAPAETAPTPAPEAAAPDQGGGDDATVADFTEPLSNYGTWIDDPTYGKVWQPADDVAGPDFVPYASDGTWAANDDGAWVYQSKYENEYGWATYHYGRWVEHDDYGWVWIPGTEWAPSWVDWRYGGGNVGWAPMGPAGYVVPEARWAFVDQVHFSDPGWRTYRMAPDRVHVAFEAAPLISVSIGGGGGGGGGHWSAGPGVASIRAAGGTVRTAAVAKPARGAVKTHAQATAQLAKSSNRPRPTVSTPVKRGSTAARANAAATPAKTQTGGAKAEAKPAGKSEPAAAASHTAAPTHGAPAAAPAAKPAVAAKPKPKPEPEAKKKPKK